MRSIAGLVKDPVHTYKSWQYARAARFSYFSRDTPFLLLIEAATTSTASASAPDELHVQP